jgi:hypothetical protein
MLIKLNCLTAEQAFEPEVHQTATGKKKITDQWM